MFVGALLLVSATEGVAGLLSAVGVILRARQCHDLRVDDSTDGGAPTGDVVYGWSVWRTAAATAVTGGVAALFGATVPSLLRGEAPYAGAGEGLVFVFVFVLVFSASSVFWDRRMPAGARFTADGAELFGARRDGVFVPWSVAPVARLRWVWPLTTLQVSVSAADSSRVTRLSRGGRAPSLRRRRDATLRFSMPLYGFAASAQSVHAEFLHRGAGQRSHV